MTICTASFHLLLLEFYIPELGPQLIHALEFEVSRCRTSLFARSFLPAHVRMWNDLSYSVFDTRTLDGFKGAVNRWLLPWVVFSFHVSQVLVWLRKQFINNLIFPSWAYAAGCNNNNNNNSKVCATNQNIQRFSYAILIYCCNLFIRRTIVKSI